MGIGGEEEVMIPVPIVVFAGIVMVLAAVLSFLYFYGEWR
jgi:hypothetical protein